MVLGLTKTDKCTELAFANIRLGVWFGTDSMDLVGRLKDAGYDTDTIKKAIIRAIKKNYKNDKQKRNQVLESATEELSKI